MILRKIANRLYNYLADFFLFLAYLGLVVPSHHFRRFVLRLGGAKIGRGSTVHTGYRFFSSRNLRIGEDTIIGSNAFLDGRGSLIIGSHVDIASEIMIYNSEHDLESEDFRARTETVEIGDFCFICPRAIIFIWLYQRQSFPSCRAALGSLLSQQTWKRLCAVDIILI